MLHVAVLGSVSSRRGETEWDTLAPGARQLLAILVAAGPNGLSAERAADELWPTELPPTWSASLRMAFTRLRRCLPPDALATKGGWCRLDLPKNEVDIWQVASHVDAETLDGEQLVAAIAQEAFPGVEVSPIVRTAIDQFDLLRLTLLDRLLEENITVPRMAAAQLRAFAARRDWDEELASRSDELSHRSTAEPPPAQPSTITDGLPGSLTRRLPAEHVGRSELVERVADFVETERRPVVTLAATPRSGRTSTLAMIGARLALGGWRIIHLQPARPRAAFAPFVQALPELRQPILDALESDHTAGEIRTRCWTSVLQAVDHPDRPTCIIVDDAEQLDSSTDEALGFIARSTTVERVVIIAGVNPGHPRAQNSEWLWSTVVDLDPLQQADVSALIGLVHPESTELQRVKLGAEIAAATGGRAGDVADLVRAMDSDTLTIPVVDAPRTQSDQLPTGLDNTTRQVSVAASIVGDVVSLADLETVTGHPPHLVLTSVDTLLGLGQLAETSRPDEFALPIPHDQWLEADDTVDLPEMHRRAMTLTRLDPVSVARHALAAHPRLDGPTVVDAQIAAATWLIAASRHREAVAHFGAAESLGASLGVDELVSYAGCLEMIGRDAFPIRSRAADAATQQGLTGAALEAAVGGLPAFEPLEGDERLVDLIRSIDPTGLGREDQLRRHLHLSRQLLLLSDRDGAAAEVERARALATTDAEEADVWLAAAHIDGWLPEGDRDRGFTPAEFSRVDTIDDPTQRARLHQAALVSALIAGDFELASATAERLEQAARVSGDPLRQWHAGVIDVTLAVNELRLDDADRLADQWSDHGVAFGLHGAVATRLAQRANTATLLNVTGELLTTFENTAPDARSTLLARAGICRLLARSGRTDEAMAMAEQVLSDVSGSRFETGVLGVLAIAVGRTSPSMAAQVREGLEPHRGKALVIGAGVNSLGPVDRLLAHVAIDDDQAMSRRHEAVELADSWQSPLWQIVSRIDLGTEYRRVGRTSEATRHLDEAAERASGTEFAERERWGLFDR